MKKGIIIFLGTLLLTTTLVAQNNISEINKIKRDKDYLYGEATLNNKEAALSLAMELLEVEIKNWAATKNAQISSVLASNVYEYADTIVLQRSNMVRAFVFVKTSNLKSIKGKNIKVDINAEEALTKPIQNDIPIEPEKKESIESASTEKAEQTEKAGTITKSEPEETSQPTVGSKPAVESKPIMSNNESEVMNKIMSIQSFYDLENVIKPLKEKGTIIDYGKYTTMSDPANCFLIIYDKDAKIQSFLGKGTTSRRNLKTGLDDSEKNYHGCGAIWLKIKE